MPEHGGNLLEAARRYAIPAVDWLDLSTGINPHAYPVPSVAAEHWQRLPQADDGLLGAARDYYGTAQLIACAGSQQAIQLLPTLRQPSRVGVISPGYNEHAHRWQRAGHQVIALAPEQLDTQLDHLDVLVVINPNNPTGHRFAPAQLLAWHRQLQPRGGWLVVVEAFIDATPEQSLATQSGRPGLIVLRSIGKFFGLPGLRGGFVLGEADLLARLAEAIGPWAVSGPAREVSRLALQDRAWQQQMRRWLPGASERLAGLLTASGLAPAGRTALFAWSPHPQAAELQDRLARQGIWTRYFAAVRGELPSLRFGLPGDEAHWQRLEQALAGVVNINLQESACP